MKREKIISMALPIISILIFFAAALLMKPTTTGLAILQPEGLQEVDAAISLKTTSEEIIPLKAIVEIELDDQMASLTVESFIQKTNQPYEIASGELLAAKYQGLGFTGDFTYTLPLSEFDINRLIAPGPHTIKTRILYNRILLFERESSIFIAGEKIK
ncbi:hypothetical protein GOV09_03795 [Candidatus Woesearchaeota archaeon]|nr:hypothetical protein [Candidatus Woesearchaeota archaeon]